MAPFENKGGCCYYFNTKRGAVVIRSHWPRCYSVYHFCFFLTIWRHWAQYITIILLFISFEATGRGVAAVPSAPCHVGAFLVVDAPACVGVPDNQNKQKKRQKHPKTIHQNNTKKIMIKRQRNVLRAYILDVISGQ